MTTQFHRIRLFVGLLVMVVMAGFIMSVPKQAEAKVAPNGSQYYIQVVHGEWTGESLFSLTGRATCQTPLPTLSFSAERSSGETYPLEIVNVTWQAVGQTCQWDVDLDASNLPAGTYVIHITAIYSGGTATTTYHIFNGGPGCEDENVCD